MNIFDNREWQSIYVSWKRIMVRTVRAKGRLLGSFVQPILFMVAFGLGLRGSGGSMEFILPGILAMGSNLTSILENHVHKKTLVSFNHDRICQRGQFHILTWPLVDDTKAGGLGPWQANTSHITATLKCFE